MNNITSRPTPFAGAGKRLPNGNADVPKAPQLPEPTPSQQAQADSTAQDRSRDREIIRDAPPMPIIPERPAVPPTIAKDALAQPFENSPAAAPRRKVDSARSSARRHTSIYLSGPQSTIGRFKQFHEENGYEAYHDALTALMNLADKALAAGHQPD